MKENFYHGMLLGILQCNDDWIVKSNQESGLGYSDIIIRIPNKQIGCIIEVKYAENASYDAACAKAMQQIQSMNYTDVFEQEELCAVHTYGVACYKKKCMVSYIYFSKTASSYMANV